MPPPWTIASSLGVLCLSVSIVGFTNICLVLVAIALFICTFLYVFVTSSSRRKHELIAEFDNMDVRQSIGLRQLLGAAETPDKTYEHDRLTGSSTLDPILEQIISYALRDFVTSWYSELSDDKLLHGSIKHSVYRTVEALTKCMRKVDWTPLLTRHLVDDFASHIRLYRRAREFTRRRSLDRDEKPKSSDQTDDGILESKFFDLELEMEQTYCRDLVSSDRAYEIAYLHELSDILLYLLIPLEDFRCQPLRSIMRDALTRQVLLPLIDRLSSADFVNETLVWLLADTPIDTDDCLTMLDVCQHVGELEALKTTVMNDMAKQRAKDTGGSDDSTIKAKLSSLAYLQQIIDRRLEELTDRQPITKERKAPDLSIAYVLSNNVTLPFFMDYLKAVENGQSLIELFLSIEGFKVSVDQQLNRAYLARVTRKLSKTTTDDELSENVREAALALYNHYLAPNSVKYVHVDGSTIRQLQKNMKSSPPSTHWFDDVQTRVLDVLAKDLSYFPAFQRSTTYVRMIDEMRNETIPADHSRASVESSPIKRLRKSSSAVELSQTSPSSPSSFDCQLHAYIDMVEVGASFAIYGIRATVVGANNEGEQVYKVMRRYSDFHRLHTVVETRFPHLIGTGLIFPGKKAFNNMNNEFLEKRKRTLNNYLQTLLNPDILAANVDLRPVVHDFVTGADFTADTRQFARKMMSFVSPLSKGVRFVGDAVTAAPDMFLGRMTRGLDSVGKATKSMLSGGGRTSPEIDEGSSSRVGDSLHSADDNDNIPIRVMMLFVDELFGVEGRTQWFRRRVVQVLRQIIHTAFGWSINRKIVDFVQWLTSEEQVAEYLTAFRNSIWPNGQLAAVQPERPHNIQMMSRTVAKTKLLSVLPDELRLMIGSDASREGIQLMFDTLQNEHLNRRLVYVLLERLLSTVFPDNYFDTIWPRLHAKSPRCQAAKMKRRSHVRSPETMPKSKSSHNLRTTGTQSLKRSSSLRQLVLRKRQTVKSTPSKGAANLVAHSLVNANS